jgi:hypothetical protein
MTSMALAPTSKKTHEREALIARQRELEYEKIEEAAKAQGARVHYRDLQGYPVVMLESPAVIALKNGYQSAFSHYLAGFTMKRWVKGSCRARVSSGH